MFYAPWCAWSRRLYPIWELAASIVAEAEEEGGSRYLDKFGKFAATHYAQGGAFVPTPDMASRIVAWRGAALSGNVAPGLGKAVAFGKVDCTSSDAVALCRANHIQAFPSIILFRKEGGGGGGGGGAAAAHSHVHYYGTRSPEALLAFLAAFERIAERRMDEEEEERIQQQEGEGEMGGRSVPLTLAKRHHLAAAHLEPEQRGLTRAGKWCPVAASAPLWTKLTAAMHKAGIVAPGDEVGLNDGKGGGKRMDGLNVHDDVGGGSGGDGGKAVGKDSGKVECSPDAVVNKGRVLEADRSSDHPSTAPPVGCSIEGNVSLVMVPGKLMFTLALGGASVNPGAVNLTHIVHELRLGGRLVEADRQHLPPLVTEGMGNLDRRLFSSPLSNVTHEHALSVVGASYSLVSGTRLHTYKFAASSHSFIDDATLPSASFSFSFSPVAVRVVESRRPVYEFLTSLCAIVGGVFTVFSLLDSLVYRGFLKTREHKARVGKLG
jgi:hypothetical protein